MKPYFILLLILSIYACSNPPKTESKATIKQETKKVDPQKKTDAIKPNAAIQFSNTEGEAVLLGERIELLDLHLNKIVDISNLSGRIVQIEGVSDSLFNQAGLGGICNSFWYVKIHSDKIKGIVNGRQVFKILDLKEKEKFTLEGNTIELLRTRFFGMGVFYQGDLMGCPSDEPIVLKDSVHNYYGLVDLVQNDYSQEASYGKTYPYFELVDNDGGYDRVDSLFAEGAKFRLRIHRMFQEGHNHSDVLFSFEKDQYKAEYLNFGARIYD